MGKSITRISGLLLAFALVFISFEAIRAQCDLSFKYKVEHTSGGNHNGKILLQLESGEGPFTIRLFDLNAGTSEFLATKKYTTFSSTGYKVVFDKLKPSDYLVRIENNECKKSLTGIEGLQIK
ncbi:MAG: hypothetical protein MI975_01850 [Cytophagales bacterium]|nr:hypothetical protein [Cytophagales bacterium]